jgi:hypothetical protein
VKIVQEDVWGNRDKRFKRTGGVVVAFFFHIFHIGNTEGFLGYTDKMSVFQHELQI